MCLCFRLNLTIVISCKLSLCNVHIKNFSALDTVLLHSFNSRLVHSALATCVLILCTLASVSYPGDMNLTSFIVCMCLNHADA